MMAGHQPLEEGLLLGIKVQLLLKTNFVSRCGHSKLVAVVHHTRDYFMTGTLLRDEEYLRQEYRPTSRPMTGHILGQW